MTDYTSEFWSKEFVTTPVTREDLRGAGIAKEEILDLTDEQMRAIASRMEDIYGDARFWEDAVTAVEFVLERRKHVIDWEKQFPITVCISRKALKEVGFTDPQIAQITDDEMYWMADVMAQNYRDSLSREDLHHLASMLFREKENPS